MQKTLTLRLTMLAVLCSALAGPEAFADTPAQRDSLQHDLHDPAQNYSIGTIRIEDKYNQNIAGYDKVYYDDMSSIYRDKQYLENFRGESPADIYKGMVGVFSGDARNSGALDTNIRGIQGQERVPVIVDGTKQAITVWRGYNGANNRNYIDPMLISSVRVQKGPSLTRDIQGSVGGAVVINTLTADDVLKPGQTFGVDIYGAVGTNTVHERTFKIDDWVGKDWRKLPRDLFPARPSFPLLPWAMYDHPNFLIWKKPKSKGGWAGQDQAYRIAAAMKTEGVELLAAYSHRNRGNYLAGRIGGQDYYSDIPYEKRQGYNFTAFMSDMYKPGNEVFNTSENTDSWLLKAAIKPGNNHKLQFGWRHTNSYFGDIFPSRVAYSGAYGMWAQTGRKYLPQWPLSNIKLNAYNLDYTWNPDDNRWIDLHANIWTTRTKSEFNSAGGWILWPVTLSWKYSMIADDPVGFGLCKENDWNCIDRVREKYDRRAARIQWTKNDEITLYSTSRLLTENDRWGFNLSNKARLAENLSLTLGAAYQYEKIDSDESWLDDPMERKMRLAGFGYYAMPRQGVRHEWEGSLRIDWQPTDKIDFSAGTLYSAYTSEDLLVNKRRAKKDMLFIDWNYLSRSGQILDEVKAWQPAKKAVADGWSPMVSASYRFNNDYSRIYTRLAHQVRMPTLFETTSGFSMVVNNTYPVKPERATNFEIGYVHDLRQLFPGARYADIKLAYYTTTIRDVIDRADAGMQMMRATNFDRKTVAGLELQSRFDSGKLFADLSLGYIVTNEVCDANEAERASGEYVRDIPKCVPNGFNGGYLQNMAPPKFTADLLLGTRFFQEKLELGTRLHYHSRKINHDSFERIYGKYEVSNPAVFLYNTPMDWKPTFTLDAYASYKLNKRTTVTLAGTNLTNRYYIDPLARTLMPAPGRALRLGMNLRF